MDKVAPETAAVYPRCSKDQNDEASVTEQGELGVARCDAEGWEPRLYPGDNDISASRFARKERDGWARLLADLRDGQLGIIWLWESSRGDRKAYEWLGFLEDCRDRGVRIYVETHGRMYDVRVARDWKTMAEDGIANAYRSEESSLQIKRHLARAAAKGRPHACAAWGYERQYDPVTRKYVTQEPVAPAAGIAAEIITRIARHDPVTLIKNDLEARGVPAPKGGTAWSRQTIRQMGLNPAYAGCRRTRDGELVKGWPEIVSLETHLAAAAVLGPRTLPARPGRQLHLLSYLAACGPCGNVLTRSTTRAGKPRYRCHSGCTYVPAEWLDDLLAGLACDALGEPDAAEVWRSDNEEAARQRAEALRLRSQLDEWAAASISARAYEIKEAKLLPQITKAEAQARALELPVVLRELLEADDVRAEWDKLEIPAQRAVIRALMTVTVDRAPDRSYAARTDPRRVTIKWAHG